MTNENVLGEMLKQRRLMIPLTLHELADRSGVSASHLGRIERGERFPSARILRRIAKPLGCEEGELFTRAGYLSHEALIIENEPHIGSLDPYVANVLAAEPIDVQRAVIGMLFIVKSLAKVGDSAEWPEFREYMRRKYPKLDEDTVNIMEDLIKRQF